ncbi:hypothetical protein [Actinomycetospora atypica]|uniref:Uncharacterized protein n=1 Tax=Actinomycetospora atypica TaxID=1290095 RepID=A0ABV9YX96_9PSEU
MTTVLDAAGGLEGMRRLALAWHERVLADDGVPEGLAIPRWSWDGLVSP